MTPRPIPELAVAAAEVLAALDVAGARGCVIGALAVHRWGEPRATSDADFSVVAPYGDELPIVDLLLERFEARRSDARAFALANRVLLLKTRDGVEVDIALAAFSFETEAIAAATPWEIVAGLWLRTCSAEHLVVYKIVAGRPHDLGDIEGIVRRQGSTLDAELIRRWARELAELKEDPDLLRPFEDVWRTVRPDR